LRILLRTLDPLMDYLLCFLHHRLLLFHRHHQDHQQQRENQRIAIGLLLFLQHHLYRQ
jgi:hypothetical protein